MWAVPVWVDRSILELTVYLQIECDIWPILACLLHVVPCLYSTESSSVWALLDSTSRTMGTCPSQHIYTLGSTANWTKIIHCDGGCSWSLSSSHASLFLFFYSDIISSTWLTFTKEHGEICFSVQLMLWSFKPYKTVSLYDLWNLLWQTLLASHVIGMTRKRERGKLQIQHRRQS